jgi:hypothetical protein
MQGMERLLERRIDTQEHPILIQGLRTTWARLRLRNTLILLAVYRRPRAQGLTSQVPLKFSWTPLEGLTQSLDSLKNLHART